MNFTNGSILKEGSKLYLLQQLTDSVFCLFEIDDHDKLKVVTDKDNKWQYSEEELPERLAGFEAVPNYVVPFASPKGFTVSASEAGVDYKPRRKTRK